MPMMFSGGLTSRQLKGPQHILLHEPLSTRGMKDGEVCQLRTSVFISAHLLIPEMTLAGALAILSNWGWGGKGLGRE